MPVPPDPLEVTSTLTFYPDTDLPELSGFVILDDAGGIVYRCRREGVGLRALIMDFVLSDPLDRVVYRIHHPEPKWGVSLAPVFPVLAAEGSPLASLRWSANQFSLQLPGAEEFTATLPYLIGGGFSVTRGTQPWATFQYSRGPDGTHLGVLTFTGPRSEPEKRRWVAVLVAFIMIFRPPWENRRSGWSVSLG
jgi:hypothetical protein